MIGRCRGCDYWLCGFCLEPLDSFFAECPVCEADDATATGFTPDDLDAAG